MVATNNPEMPFRPLVLLDQLAGHLIEHSPHLTEDIGTACTKAMKIVEEKYKKVMWDVLELRALRYSERLNIRSSPKLPEIAEHVAQGGVEISFGDANEPAFLANMRRSNWFSDSG
jgi:hypothetical protein